MPDAIDLIAREFAPEPAPPAKRKARTRAASERKPAADCDCSEPASATGGKRSSKKAAKKSAKKTAKKAAKKTAKKTGGKQASSKKATSKKATTKKASRKPKASKGEMFGPPEPFGPPTPSHLTGTPEQVRVPAKPLETKASAWKRAAAFLRTRFGKDAKRADYTLSRNGGGFTFTRVNALRRRLTGAGEVPGDLIESPHVVVTVKRLRTTAGDLAGVLVATPLAANKRSDGAKANGKGDLYKLSGLKSQGTTGHIRSKDWQKVRSITIAAPNAGRLVEAARAGRLRFRWQAGDTATLAIV